MLPVAVHAQPLFASSSARTSQVPHHETRAANDCCPTNSSQSFFVSYASWNPKAPLFVSHANSSPLPPDAVPPVLDSSLSLPTPPLLPIALPTPPMLPISLPTPPMLPISLSTPPMLPPHKPTTISEILAIRKAERAAAAAVAAAAAQAALDDEPTTTMSDALAPGILTGTVGRAATKHKKKRNKGESTVRFASSTKATANARASKLVQPVSPAPRKQRGTAGELEGPQETDEGQPLRIDTADKDAWVAEQAAITNALMVAYGKAGRGATARGGKDRKVQRTQREYVPKPRKTQRAKQKRPLDPSEIRLRHLGLGA
jgi:hypothetical protein